MTLAELLERDITAYTRTFRKLQQEYGKRECPECEDSMTLHDDEYGNLVACCSCGYQEEIDEEDI